MAEKYDVAIIGAGIGGLVCGCYLAKAGLKVIIVEQHNKPGGYCTSFERQGYRFDVGVHYFGGINNGLMGRILDELCIRDQITFKQFDPTDKIIMPDVVTYIRANPLDTIEEFKNKFPKEKNNIDRFFDFIMQKNFVQVYAKTKGHTFEDILNSFFKDNRLKATLGVLVSNIGASPAQAVAFPSLILLRQYSLEPGFYPIGGVQAFPDILTKYFKEKGGELILSEKVTEIIFENKVAVGIRLDKGKKVISKIVVSNADATETFKELINTDTIESRLVNKMKISPSMFIVYLGLKVNLKKILDKKCNVFYFSSYDVNTVYNDLDRNVLKDKLPWLICDFPSLHDCSVDSEKSTAIIMMCAPYKTRSFWNKHKEILSDKMINLVQELNIIPDIEKYIDLKIIGTPHTLYKYTNNRAGSFSGWLPTVKQTGKDYIPQETSVPNLYLAGHWCSTGYLHYGGIPNVVFLGRRASILILRKLKKIQ